MIDYTERSRAGYKLNLAVKNGELTRPDTCELCGNTPDLIKVNYYSETTTTRSQIVGHHWNGHKNALDIWWICQSCNHKLIGSHFHDGSISKEESRKYVLNFKRKEYATPPAQKIFCHQDGCNRYASIGEIFCHHHLPNNDPTCKGITKTGRRCGRKAGLRFGYCFSHWNQIPITWSVTSSVHTHIHTCLYVVWRHGRGFNKYQINSNGSIQRLIRLSEEYSIEAKDGIITISGTIKSS